MEASWLSRKEARVETICLGGRVSSVGEVVSAVDGMVCSVAAVVSGGGPVDSTLASVAVSGGGSSAPGDVAVVCAGADPGGSAADAVSTGVKQDSTSISRVFDGLHGLPPGHIFVSAVLKQPETSIKPEAGHEKTPRQFLAEGWMEGYCLFEGSITQTMCCF